MKGLGIGVIIGAVLLQLMLLVRDTDKRIQEPGAVADTSAELQLTAKLVKEKADSLQLQVYDKGIKLYEQKQLDEAVRIAVEAAKAEASANRPEAGAQKEISIYITEGMPAVSVADYLQKAGIIADRSAFESAIIQQRLTFKIRSGLYSFHLNENIPDVISRLTTPPSP